MDETPETASGVSRRVALKRLAAGTAAAWAAPALLSVSASAGAASTVCPTCSAGGDACFEPCGDGPNGACLCARKTDGTCACFTPICSSTLCAADGDCPEGWACVAQCCGPPTCAPLCSTRVSGTQLRAGAWAPAPKPVQSEVLSRGLSSDGVGSGAGSGAFVNPATGPVRPPGQALPRVG